MLQQDVFFQKNRLNTAFKYFDFRDSLKKFAKCRTGKKVLRKKSKSLVPAKYKVPYFYWSTCRNREKNKPSIYTCIFPL